MRYFISDNHFFHKNILGFGQRDQFKTVEEMHTYMITAWNKTVSFKDIVYVVGDFSFGNYEDTKEILQQLKGRKILIRGNHDGLNTYEYINMGFYDVRDEMYIKLNKERILLKHYPYHKPFKQFINRLLGRKEYQRNYQIFFPVDKGLWHINGHYHGGPLVKGKEINVSCETLNYVPISEVKIQELITGANK